MESRDATLLKTGFPNKGDIDRLSFYGVVDHQYLRSEEQEVKHSLVDPDGRITHLENIPQKTYVWKST